MFPSLPLSYYIKDGVATTTSKKIVNESQENVVNQKPLVKKLEIKPKNIQKKPVENSPPLEVKTEAKNQKEDSK
jgi:hypothetical protein